MANAIATYQIGFKADTAQLKKSLDETLSILNKLGKENSLVSGLEEAGDAALELSRILKSSINTNTGLLDITTLRDNINLVGGDLRQYALQLEKLGTEGQDAFYQVARAIVTAEDPLRRSGKLMNSLWENMEKVVKYQFSYKTLNLFTGSLRAAYEYSQDLNESLNKIKIVTGNSSEEMAKFAEKANNAAKALSTTTTAYTDASYIYALQGLNAEEMEKRTAITIKMSQVTGDSAEDVSSYMTAIWNNFYDGSKSLEYFGDVLTKLGSTTASTTSEIADGLERFASLADTVGLSYEYATASLATIVAETRRSADTVGTALNAIFTRLQGLKLGEELDDGTDLNKYSKALETVGISIKDTTGQVKDLDTILNELGSRWKTLAKDEQIALAQTVAGQRQYATLIALMDNWDKVLENITRAGGSTGELNRQADDYAESWKAARDEVKAAAEGIYDSLIDSDILINANKSLASFLGIIENVIDGLGGMNGLFSTTGSILTRVFSDKIAQTMREMVTNTKIMLGLEKQKSQEYKNQTLAILDELEPLETASDYENVQIVFLKEEIKLRQTIEQNRDKMSANTKKILEEGISQLTQMQNYSLELLKLQDSLSLKSQDSFAKLETVSQEINKTLNSFNDEVTPAIGYSKPTNEFRQTFNKFIKDSFPGLVQADSFNTNSFAIEITPDLKFTNLKGDKKTEYGKNFKQYATVFKDLSKYNANLELFRKSWDKVGQEIDENIPKFKQVLSVFKVLSQEEIEQINSVEDLNYAYRNATEYFDRTKEAVRILNEYFQSDTVQSSDSARTAIDNLNKELEEYIKNLVRARNANLDYLNVQDQNQNSTQVIEGFNKTLENKATLPEKKDWASYITQISNSLFSFYSVIQALDNLPQIFKNEDLSAGEKLLQTVMSLGQVFQGFSGQVIMLKRAEDAQAIAQKNLNTVIAQGGTEVEKAAAKTLLASQTIQASLSWIGLVITGVTTAVRVVKFLFDYVDQQKQKEIELQRELQQERLEEIDQVQGLIENYYELEKTYSETGEGKEELLETIEKLNEKLNLESVQVDLLAGRYSHLTEQIREAEKAQREQKIKELQDKLDLEATVFGVKADKKTTLIGKYFASQEERDLITNSSLYKEYGIASTSPLKSFTFSVKNSTDAKEALHQLQLYKELQSQIEKKGLDNTSLYVTITNQIRETEKLLEPYKEILDQLSNEKLNQIRENFNFNPTSLEEYKESMAEAEKTAQKLIKDGKLTQEQWEAEKIDLSNNNEQLQKYSTLLTIGEEYRKKFFKDIDLTELEDRLDAEQLQIVLQAILDEDSLVEVQNRINQSYAEAYYSRLNKSREDLETVALNSNTSGEISEEDWEILKNNSDFMEAVEEKYGELKNLQHQSIAEQLEFVNSVYVATQKLSYDSLQMLEDTYNKEYNIISQKISDLEQLQANGNTYLKELGNLRVRATEIETEQDLQEVETLLKNIKKRAKEEAGIDISWLNLDNLNEVDLSELYHKLDEAKEKILDLGDQKIELSLDWNDYDALAGTFEQIENFAADIKDETKLVGDNYTYASSEMRKWLSIYPELFSQAVELENGLMGLNKETVDAFVEGQRTEAKSAIDNQIEQWKTQKEAAEARKQILEKTLEAFTESKKGELEVSKLDATQKGLISQRLSDYLIENGWSVEKAHAEAIKIMGGDYFDFAKYIGDEIIDPTYNNWGTMLDQLPIDTVTTLQRMADSWKSFANGLNSVAKAVQMAINGLDTNVTVDFNFKIPTGPKIHPLLLRAIKPLNLDAGGNSPYGPNDGSAGQDGGLPSYVRQFNIGDLIEDFKSDYINSLNAEIANTQFEIDTLNAKILHATDRLNNPLGTFDKDKNGSGKDSSKSPDQKEIEDTFEKYHEITREIEYQEKALQKLEKQADRTYGLDKLKSYAQQQEKLNKLEELQNDKLKLANTYLAGDQAILEGYGMQLDIDPETKEIKNFTSLKEQALKEYQDYLKKYNAMTPDQQEAVKEELEAQGKLYEEKLKMLDEYKKDLDEAREIEEKLIEIRQQKRDKRIIEITEVLRVKLDVKSVEDAADEFTKTFRESWGDYLDYGNQSRDIDASKAKREKGLLDDYKNQYVDLLNELKNPIDLNTETVVVEKLKELQNNIISSGESLIEWARNLREVVPQALEAAQERFSKFTNQLQHNTTIASSIKDLLELQRIVTKTGKGFDLVQKAQIAGYQANLVSAKLNKQRADEAYKNLVLAEEALANETEGTYSYEILKSNRDALLAEFNSAQDALLEASKSALEDAKTYYLNAIEEAAYQADLIFSKGEGLDLLSDKLNNYLDEEEMYLDVVNEAYEADKWNNKLQNDIDNARDKRTKQMYEDLQKELEIRRGNNELSEYDLDIMDAKYKMLQAQIALEDAQNNKTTLRLVRDRQGNWNYQYTANEDEVDKAQQGLADAQNEWYNIAKRRNKELAKESVEVTQQMMSDLTELYRNKDTMPEEEFLRRKEEIIRHATEKMIAISRERQIAEEDMTEAGKLTITDFENHYAGSLKHLGVDLNDFEQGLDDFEKKATEAVGEYGKMTNKVVDEVGIGYDDLNAILNTTTESTKKVSEEGNKAVTTMWKQIEAAREQTQSFRELANEIQRVASELNNLSNQAAQTIKITSKVPTETGAISPSTGGTDLSMQAALAFKNAGYEVTPEVESLLKKRQEKIDSLSPEEREKLRKQNPNGWLRSSDDILKILLAAQTDGSAARDLVNQILQGLVYFDTGGYTGSFDNAKLAFLHEKELVLNQEDTENILKTVNIIREFENILDNRAKISSQLASSQLDANLHLLTLQMQKADRPIAQNIEINAEFPDVQAASEIEAAFDNLLNRASQYINIKGK